MHKRPDGRTQVDISQDPNFHSANNQWIIDNKCPFYEKFLPLFDHENRGIDESDIKKELGIDSLKESPKS